MLSCWILAELSPYFNRITRHLSRAFSLLRIVKFLSRGSCPESLTFSEVISKYLFLFDMLNRVCIWWPLLQCILNIWGCAALLTGICWVLLTSTLMSWSFLIIPGRWESEASCICKWWLHNWKHQSSQIPWSFSISE